MKDRKLGFLVNALALIVTLAATVLYIMNVNTAYYSDMNIKVLGLFVAAAVLLCVALFFTQRSRAKAQVLLFDLMRVAAAALLIYAATSFVSMRVESFGYIFGSNLEMNNAAAQSAGNQAVLTIIVSVVAWVLVVLSSFFELTAKKREA
ncbi:MAG: hypothetical protein Q4D52_01495 [Eubacteriales bacterium]|nr:hypothetical protein [Eubacteriales bacterium]